jgi:hypothetical protein
MIETLFILLFIGAIVFVATLGPRSSAQDDKNDQNGQKESQHSDKKD